MVCTRREPILEELANLSADVNGLQAYTIRKMDQYMPTGRDIEHYKLLSTRTTLEQSTKEPMRLEFSHPFYNWKYGEFHPHLVKLTFSEYIKSRLMNTDSRFCKNPSIICNKRNSVSGPVKSTMF